MSNWSEYLPGILLAYSAFFIAIASPGPNVLAVLATSLGEGRRQGMAIALGIACGSFCWAVITVSGLSALLTLYASALIAIKILGGLYLLWLAFKAFRSASSASDRLAAAEASDREHPFRLFFKGWTIMMTNPKAALAWIAIASLGMKHGAPLWVGAAIVLGTSLLSVTIHLGYALAFSSPVMVGFYRRARRTIQFVMGSLFAAAGMKLLASRS